MLALLRTRRWMGFTAVVIGAIVAFGILSAWQWSRADTKRLEKQQIEGHAADDPVDLADLRERPLAVGEWRPVEVVGRYADEYTSLVRKRPLNGSNGMWVLTPLVVDEPDGSETWLWVNRGWIKAAGAATQSPAVPPAPAGEVTVMGLARAMEEAGDNSGLPTGQVAAAATENLPATQAVGGVLLQAQESRPTDSDLAAVPIPSIDDARNVSYAIQWILFALIASGGWFYFLRREAREDTGRAGGDSAADHASSTTAN